MPAVTWVVPALPVRQTEMLKLSLKYICKNKNHKLSLKIYKYHKKYIKMSYNKKIITIS